MMYLSHFHLKLQPFQINTDQRFLYLSEKHQEALAILRYGIVDNRGVLVLTGDVGTGKTILVHALLNSLGPDVLTAVITDPSLKGLDFFNFVAHAFGMETGFKTKGEFLIHLGSFLDRLYKAKRQVLLVIDEAQNIDPDQLENIRILSDLERENYQRINVFFVGQSEFNLKLADSRLRALKQRITTHYHIQPLTLKEAGQYVQHRLTVAGCDRPLFTPSAIKKIFEITKGYPRLINIVCDHCLLSGFVKDLSSINPTIVMEAAADLMHPSQYSAQPLSSPENQPSVAKAPDADIHPSAATRTLPVVNTHKTAQATPSGHLKPFALFLPTFLRKPAYLLAVGVLFPALVWLHFKYDPHSGRQVPALVSTVNQENNTDTADKTIHSSRFNSSIQGAPHVESLSADRAEVKEQSENLQLPESSPSTEHNRPMDAMAENNLNRSTEQSPSNAVARHNRSNMKPSEVKLPIRSVTATLGKRTIDNEELPSSILKLDEIAAPNEKMVAADIVDQTARLSSIPLASDIDDLPMPAEKKGGKAWIDTNVTSVLPETASKTVETLIKNSPDQATKTEFSDEAPLASSAASLTDTPMAEPTAGDLQFQDTAGDPRAIIDFVMKKRTHQASDQ